MKNIGAYPLSALFMGNRTAMDKMKKYIFLVRHFPICAIVLVSLTFLSETQTQFGDSGGNSVQNGYSIGKGIPAKNFSSVVVDDHNIKWFITEAGIVSFNGKEWKLHNKNRKVPAQNLKDFALERTSQGMDFWIASPVGVTMATLPLGRKTDATTYHPENSSILSKNVVRVAIGKNLLHWLGTDKGVSAFKDGKWLTPSYIEMYPENMFEEFKITSMAANLNGDSLYIGTEGAGVARVYRNNVDAISGASSYAQWGPIILPSDNIYSIFIAPDGSQWFGTDQGIARHAGNKTLSNWTAFTTSEGLVNNFVQAIASDNNGKLWFGTKGGVSVFDGSVFTSFTTDDGLISNNVLCIAADHDGVVWLGTDNGVTCYQNGKFISYK
jgi:hypothetical protein